MTSKTSIAPENTRASRKRHAALLGGGVLGSAALVLAMSGTLSAFSASIQNTTNSGGVGSLTMTETGPGSSGQVSCSTTVTATSVTCGTINKYGGSMAMTTSGTGSSITTTITIQNTGTLAASTFTLTPGACALTNPNSLAGNLCNSASVTVVQDGTTKVSGVSPTAMTANGAYTLVPVAAGATSTIQITFSTAGLDNTFQGEWLSQPLTWTLNA